MHNQIFHSVASFEEIPLQEKKSNRGNAILPKIENRLDMVLCQDLVQVKMRFSSS